MKNIIGPLVISAVALSAGMLSGCSDAQRSAMLAANKPHIIKQFSGPALIGQWESTGIVKADDGGAGYYFEDASTRTIVEVTGTLQITIKPSAQ